MQDGVGGMAVDEEKGGKGGVPVEVLDRGVVDEDSGGGEGFEGPDPGCCWGGRAGRC